MSYKCSQCGIKVNAEEGSPCPGCGNTVETAASSSLGKSLLGGMLTKPKVTERTWIQKVFDQCDEWFQEIGGEEDLVNSDLDEVTPKVVAYALQKAEEAEDPQDRISLYSYSGRFSMLLKKYDEAITYARIGLKSSLDFYRNQSYETLFRSYAALRQFESMAKLENDAARDNFPDLVFYQITCARLERDFDRELKLIEIYYAEYPVGKLYAQCGAYVEMGDIARAESGYQKLITTSSKDMLAGAVINSYCFAILIPQKRYDEARELLLRATNVSDPRESINAWSNLGIIAMAEDKFSEAREHFAKAIDSDDTDIRNESRYFLCLMNFREYKAQFMPASDSRWSELLKHTQEGIHTGDSEDIFRCTQLMIDTASYLEILPTFASPVEAALERLESDPLVNIKGSDEYLNRKKLVALVASMYRALGDFEKFESIPKSEDLKENPEILLLLLEHLQSRTCSADLKNHTMHVASPTFMTEWAGFETDPIILAKLSIAAGPELAMALVGNIVTPTHALAAISTILDINVLFKICSHPNVDQEILHSLSKSEFDAVRRGVASSEKTNDQTLQELALDSSVAVREAIKNNPSASDETKTLAALG